MPLFRNINKPISEHNQDYSNCLSINKLNATKIIGTQDEID